MTSKLTIRSKLAAALAVPLIALAALVAVQVRASVHDTDQAPPPLDRGIGWQRSADLRADGSGHVRGPRPDRSPDSPRPRFRQRWQVRVRHGGERIVDLRLLCAGRARGEAAKLIP